MTRLVPNRTEATRIYRVGELNREARDLLEEAYGRIWVEGELSEVRRHGSGHVYFTLNDPKEVAQLRGVMFRSDARRAKATLERGTAIRFQGSVSLYPERGQYQLVARVALPAGAGDLHAQLERLKAKLAAEGLMSTERKRSLPRYPSLVGVVTSAEGAAMHDIVRVSEGRFPARLLVSDCRVQGESAPREIVNAIRRLERVEGLDVIIVARGGGSGEDLWAFNHETVARAVAAARVPVVVGVGHETDVTLADLVADMRAATPSNAAELVLPEYGRVLEALADLNHRLERAAAAHIDRKRLGLARIDRRMGGPRADLRRARHSLDQAAFALGVAMRARARQRLASLTAMDSRLAQHDVRRSLANHRNRLGHLHGELRRLIAPTVLQSRRRFDRALAQCDGFASSLVRERREELELLTARLESMSPYRVLERGYAIVVHQGAALTDAERTRPGDPLEIRLHQGSLIAYVDRIRDAAGEAPKENGQ